MKAQRICPEPGCSTVGPCPTHARKQGWRHSLSRHARGYDSAHVRRRAQVLREEPSCRYCGAPSTTMDHMIPKSQGGTDERANLAGACTECQQSKAGREGRAARMVH